MVAPVILGVDASRVFEPVEHILDFVPLTVECFIEAGRQFSSLSWRDTRGDANCLQGSAILVTVISFVTDQCLGMVWKCPIKSALHRYGRSSGLRSGTGSKAVHHRHTQRAAWSATRL